ncbi:MAG: hypothetical protein WBW53_12455 [Terriglobales bacterium]
MRPEIKAKRKIEALQRRRALIDALIEFIRTHPLSVDGSSLIPLANRMGLRYDFAVIRPLWAKGEVALRLEKWLEDWYDLHPEDADFMVISPNQIVKEDVSDITDEQLSEILDDLHRELIPEDFKAVEDELDR